ncbi:MAG TPA: isoprenyl transferase [Phycisphaerae bacterium]|nr:isoprenyl transferase [Phycisphaerae bacterium]
MDQKPLDPRQELGIDPDRLPRHIAIIMDGNGRWARQRNLPRIKGHEQGAKAVRAVVTHCARLGIEALTLYSFSSENWKRPRIEVDFLMELYRHYLVAERQEIMQNDVRLVHVGQRDGLPDGVLTEMDITINRSAANKGLKLCLALNYGSRAEIVDAVRKIAADVRDAKIDLDDIDERLISNSLCTAGLPDPDLLIRTASEHRISNFLLWQISYSELHICDVLWPDFGPDQLNDAIRDFAGRDRRFGALPPSP